MNSQEKIVFKCANCLKETKVSAPGNVTLVCQKCGCVDISFSHDILVKPLAPGQFLSDLEVVLSRANEPFLGRSKYGDLWFVSIPPVSSPVKPEVKIKLRKK